MSARLPLTQDLAIATHNAGKMREFEDLFQPFSVTLHSAASLDLPEPEETGLTYEANAALKAHAAAKAAGKPALSDDSGLSVDALDGAPGIYSARWAGPDKDFAMAMRTVEEKLQSLGATDRTARFVCSLCLAFPDGEEMFFTSEVEGQLVWPPVGTQGFGYDPVFRPNGYEITFGEMEAHEKHHWRPGVADPLSHRARAFANFAQKCLIEKA